MPEFNLPSSLHSQQRLKARGERQANQQQAEQSQVSPPPGRSQYLLSSLEAHSSKGLAQTAKQVGGGLAQTAMQAAGESMTQAAMQAGEGLAQSAIQAGKGLAQTGMQSMSQKSLLPLRPSKQPSRQKPSQAGPAKQPSRQKPSQTGPAKQPSRQKPRSPRRK